MGLDLHMDVELTVLVVACLWGIAQLIAQGQAGLFQHGSKWALGPRDSDMPPLNPIAGRLERNFRNFMETFPFFAAAVLIAELAGVHNALTRWGAITYLAGRVVYTAIYVAGIPVARSLVWNLAAIGMLAVLLAPFL